MIQLGLEEKRTRWALGGFLVLAFAAVIVLELVSVEGSLSVSAVLAEVLELSLIALSIGGLVLLLQRVRFEQAERRQLMHDLELARAEGEAWRGEAKAYVEGLGAVIERQFDAWCLSPAEREVGLLMLKGFTHEEIASLRSTAAATTRQHAYSIYKKSGLPNRTSFAAYFLEDLLPTTMLDASTPR